MSADPMPRVPAADRASGTRSVALPSEDAVPERAPHDGASDERAVGNLRAWHEADWRFLLPDPQLSPVWLAPECAAEGAVLRTLGVELVSEPADGTELAFVDGSRFDFSLIEHTLPPGALVRIAVAGTHGLRAARQECRWGVAERLEGRGWQVLGRVWAAGGIEAAVGYVDRDNRHAVTHWWRTLEPRGTRARVTVALRLALARIGLWRLPCHEGFVFARTPM